MIDPIYCIILFLLAFGSPYIFRAALRFFRPTKKPKYSLVVNGVKCIPMDYAPIEIRALEPKFTVYLWRGHPSPDFWRIVLYDGKNYTYWHDEMRPSGGYKPSMMTPRNGYVKIGDL